MKPITEVMQWIKQIDQMPVDHALVMYLKKRIEDDEMQSLVQSVQDIRAEKGLPITLILPYEELELQRLTDEQKTRVIHALGGFTASEVRKITEITKP